MKMNNNKKSHDDLPEVFILKWNNHHFYTVSFFKMSILSVILQKNDSLLIKKPNIAALLKLHFFFLMKLRAPW